MTEASNLSETPLGPYHGALFDPSRKFSEIAGCIKLDLKESFPKSAFKIIRRIQSLGRSLEIQIIEHDGDLADLITYQILKDRITSIAQKYGYDRSQYTVDLIDRHFSLSISFHPDYWKNPRLNSIHPHVQNPR